MEGNEVSDAEALAVFEAGTPVIFKDGRYTARYPNINAMIKRRAAFGFSHQAELLDKDTHSVIVTNTKRIEVAKNV